MDLHVAFSRLAGSLGLDLAPRSLPPATTVFGACLVEFLEAHIPDPVLASSAWRSAAARVVETTPEGDRRRIALTVGLLVDRVLVHLKPVASRHGFGDAWDAMLLERTADSATAAASAASRAGKSADSDLVRVLCEDVAKAGWNAAWVAAWTDDWAPLAQSARIGGRGTSLCVAYTAKAIFSSSHRGLVTGFPDASDPAVVEVWFTLDPAGLLTCLLDVDADAGAVS